MMNGSDLLEGDLSATESISYPKKGGTSVIKALSSRCFKKITERHSINDHSIFENNDTFYHSFTIYAGLSVGLKGMFTMGKTLFEKTKLSNGEVEVSGASINKWNHVSSAILDKDCIAESRTILPPDLLRDLNDLPTVANPEAEEAWILYRNFLKKIRFSCCCRYVLRGKSSLTEK